MRKPFDQTYLEIVKKIAEDRSEDKFTKVAALATDKNNGIIGISYNGTKPGYEFNFNDSLEENRDKKNALMFHAEQSLVSRCRYGEIYTVYLTHSPCISCAKLLCLFGVKKVYFLEEYHREQWYKYIFNEYGVYYKQISIL